MVPTTVPVSRLIHWTSVMKLRIASWTALDLFSYPTLRQISSNSSTRFGGRDMLNLLTLPLLDKTPRGYVACRVDNVL